MNDRKRMRLRDLRSRLKEMLDNGNVDWISIDHAPAGVYGCCTEPSEWTFTLHDSVTSVLDTVRWSEGQYSSETGFIEWGHEPDDEYGNEWGHPMYGIPSDNH